MPAPRTFGAESKSTLAPYLLSPDELNEALNTRTGIQDLLLDRHKDHLIRSRRYNLLGYVLQLFEHLGRNTNVAQVIAASEDPKLTERSVVSSISKLNEILYITLGLRIRLNRETGELRLVNENDLVLAPEKLKKRFGAVAKEWIRAARALEATDGPGAIDKVLDQMDSPVLREMRDAMRTGLLPAASA
jgi:hypothetical protein